MTEKCRRCPRPRDGPQTMCSRCCALAKTWREARVARGICAGCAQQRDGVQKFCSTCRAKQSAAAAAKIERNLCPKCSAPRDGETQLCNSCNAKQAARIIALKEAGICEGCRVADALPERTLCATCCKTTKTRHATHRERRRSTLLTDAERLCSTCIQIFPADNFLTYKTRDGVEHPGTQCAQCRQRRFDAAQNDERWKLIAETNAVFLSQGCAECGGEAHEIDHLAHKTKAMTDIKFWMDNLPEYHKELSTCQPLCTHHHRIKTSEAIRKRPPAPRVIRGHEHVKQLKLARGECAVCKTPCTEANFRGFDWDHVDPMSKREHVSALIKAPPARIDAEVALCRLVCSRCHHKHTVAQKRANALPRKLPTPKKLKQAAE